MSPETGEIYTKEYFEKMEKAFLEGILKESEVIELNHAKENLIPIQLEDKNK